MNRITPTSIILWTLLGLMLVIHVRFDIQVAPIGFRLAQKARAQKAIGNPTYTPNPDISVRGHVQVLHRFLPIGWIGLRVFTARYALTALPLLLVLSFAALKRLREIHLAEAVAAASFLLVAKVLLWDTVLLAADVATKY